MKNRSDRPEMLRTHEFIAAPEASAGFQGIAMPSPTYGISRNDIRPIQAMRKPMQERQALEAITQPTRSRVSQPLAPTSNAGIEAPEVQDQHRAGLPHTLQAGVEALSGLVMDDVKVHYNSKKPAQLQALAYTIGTDIYVAPGQERHLPHEAWHVAQQKQGRVKPTTQLKSQSINKDPTLEQEADQMGAQVLVHQGPDHIAPLRKVDSSFLSATKVTQGIFYANTTAELLIPRDYAAIRVPWNDAQNSSEDRDTTAQDPTIGTLLQGSKAAIVRNYFASGADIPSINSVVVEDDHEKILADRNITLTDWRVGNFLNAAYFGVTNLATITEWETYNSPKDVPFKLIPRPKDMLPEVPDLAHGNYKPGFVCTLIALFKTAGAATINTKLGIHPRTNSMPDVIQAMHTYYLNQGIQYDDTATHVQLLKNFDWKIVYAGPTDWFHLHYFYALDIDTDYIFDIVGHTVKVRKIAEIPKHVQLTALNIDTYYAPESEAWNFTPHATHYKRDVLYIYGK